MSDIDEQKKQAELDKLRADAAKAQADADKAVAEARSAATKALAEERAEAEARAAEAVQQRDAAAQKATDEANRDAAKARREQLSALIPDFGAVEGGSLAVEGDAPMGTALVQRAIGSAAAKVVAGFPEIGGRPRVLVTNEEDLATSDAAYFEVVNGLEQLESAAGKLLAADTDQPRVVSGTPLDLVAALAGAVPGLLSLFSANRTVKTAAATVSDLSATAATVGALKHARKDWTIVHDDVRLLERGDVGAKLDALSARRHELMGHKLHFETTKARKTAELVTRRAEEAAAAAALDKAAALDRPAAQAKLDELREQVQVLDVTVTGATLRIGLIDSLAKAIDDFTTQLVQTPEGETRSPFARAMLRQGLHVTENGFTHVLLVKGAGGSTTQTVNDKPLFFKDEISIVATAGISFVFLQTADNSILAAGNHAASATMYGKVGRMLEVSHESRP